MLQPAVIPKFISEAETADMGPDQKRVYFADRLNPKSVDDLAKNSQPRFTVRNAAFALQYRPPISYLVDNLIRPGSVNVFYGAPGAKKTSSLLSMAVCVAMGKTWLGRKTKKVKVLWLDEELGEEDYSRLLGAAILGEQGGENIPLQFVSFAGWNFYDKNDPSILEQIIADHEAGIVFIDALSKIMIGGDENLVKDVMPVIQALKRVALHTGAAINAVHHANKLGGFRGSSTILQGVDLMVKVASENGSNHIEFSTDKVRYGAGINSWAAEATWKTDPDEFYLTERNVEKYKPMRPGEMYIKNYLEAHGPTSLKELEKSAEGCTQRQAKDAIYLLVKQGVIKRTNPNEKGKGHYAIYALA